MKYAINELYQLFSKSYPHLLHRKHRVESITFLIEEELKNYQKKYNVPISPSGFIPPTIYIGKPSKKMIMCLELVNKYTTKYPRFLSGLFVKSMIIHDSLHAFLGHTIQDRDTAEKEVHKIQKRYYLTYYLIFEIISIGGIFRYLKFLIRGDL